MNANFMLLEAESNAQNLRLELAEDALSVQDLRIGVLEAQPSGGDITGVIAGTGLTGGGSAGDVTLSADLVTLQARVTGSCPAGQSIRAINALGGVTCEIDDGLAQSSADALYVNVAGDTVNGQLRVNGGLGLNQGAFGDALLSGFGRAADNWISFFRDSSGAVRFTIDDDGGIGLNQQGFPDALISGRARAADNWLLFLRNDANQIALNTNQDGDLFLLGQANVESIQIRGGADIAEPFDFGAKERVEPGMVVAIDSERPGELRLSSMPYDRAVAGIVSGAGGIRPGLTLTQEDSPADGEHAVALTGRVYTWVDADANGPVRPGDMLTTSGTPGFAMRASDPNRSFGAVLGKAMGNLDQGRGLVLTLVNLQ